MPHGTSGLQKHDTTRQAHAQCNIISGDKPGNWKDTVAALPDHGATRTTAKGPRPLTNQRHHNDTNLRWTRSCFRRHCLHSCPCLWCVDPPTGQGRLGCRPPSPFASTKDASGQQPLWLPHRIHALCNVVDRVVVSTSRQVVKHIHGQAANIAQTMFHAALWWYLPVWPSPGNSSPCDGATATSARFVSGTRGQWECFRIRAVIRKV